MSSKTSLNHIIHSEYLLTPPQERNWTRASYIERIANDKVLHLSRLRVHDPEKGGLLYVPNRSNELPALAVCTSRNEVAFSRAIFNSRTVKSTNTDNTLGFLSYEAPLLRRQNKDSNANQLEAKCDLVALAKDSQIILIEVKVSCGRSTNLDYALMEGAAYCAILQAVLANNGCAELFAKEVSSCILQYHNSKLGSKLPTRRVSSRYRIKFAVAAPRCYYAKQMQTPKYKESAEQVFRALKKKDFFGFLVFPDFTNAVKFIEIRFPNPVNPQTFLVPFLGENTCRMIENLKDLAALQEPA